MDKWNVIGLWGMRITLVMGAVVAGIMGAEEISGTCVVGLVVSFWLLGDN